MRDAERPEPAGAGRGGSVWTTVQPTSESLTPTAAEVAAPLIRINHGEHGEHGEVLQGIICEP